MTKWFLITQWRENIWSCGRNLFYHMFVMEIVNVCVCVCVCVCVYIRGLSKKYPTLNFPVHSSDARAAPPCTEEGDSLMRTLEFFLRVRVCKSLPAGRRVRCCYTCSSDLGFLSRWLNELSKDTASNFVTSLMILKVKQFVRFSRCLETMLWG